jgi:hypothetical protein
MEHYHQKGDLIMTDVQNDSAEKPLPEPSNPLPKGKAGSWDRSRLLTPSELKSLKENSIAAEKIAETRFREIFNKNKTL